MTRIFGLTTFASGWSGRRVYCLLRAVLSSSKAMSESATPTGTIFWSAAWRRLRASSEGSRDMAKALKSGARAPKTAKRGAPRELLARSKGLADGIATLFFPYVEVIVHDL